MYNFPDDHDWGQKRAYSLTDNEEDQIQQHLDYEETENNEPLLQPVLSSEEEHLT